MRNLLLIFLAVCMVGAVQGAPHVIEVKPGGSLEAARDAARALPAEKRADGVEIVLAPGVYRRSATLKLDARDAGVTWRSADGGRAVICDGIELKPARFKPVPEGTPRRCSWSTSHRRTRGSATS